MIRTFGAGLFSLFFTIGAHAQLKIFDVNQVARMSGVVFLVTRPIVAQPNQWTVNQGKDAWMVRQFVKSDHSALVTRGVVVRPSDEKARFKSVLSVESLAASGPDLNFSYYASSKGDGVYLDCSTSGGCVNVSKRFCQSLIEKSGGPDALHQLARQCGVLASKIQALKLPADEFASAKEAIKADMKELLSYDAGLGKRAASSVDKLSQADAMAPNNMMRTVDACLNIYERTVASEVRSGEKIKDWKESPGVEREDTPADLNPSVDIPASGFIDERPAAGPAPKKNK
jgi:hypothetical protein